MLLTRERNAQLKTLEMEASLILRPPLFTTLRNGEKITRFTGNDLPSGVVIDNVKKHTLRCFDISKSLNIPIETYTTLQKIVLFHDLPEIENLIRLGLSADMTAPDKKANPELAQKVEESETTVAKEILNEDEYPLYSLFENGALYLKHGNQEHEFSAIGALAKTIDVVDASLMLHESLTTWALTSDDYIPELLKPRMSLSYAFSHVTTMAVYLNHSMNSHLREAGLDLISKHFHSINQLWSNVYERGRSIPGEIEEYI